MIEGLFISLDVATLTAMKAEWQACLTAIATAHQSYSIAGRAFTRANLKDVSQTLAEISYALALNSGQLQRTVYSDMSNS